MSKPVARRADLCCAVAFVVMTSSSALAQSQTHGSIFIGGQYESNSPHRDPKFLTFDDATASTGLNIANARVIRDSLWVSDLQLYANLHNRWHPGDLWFAAARTGPSGSNDFGTWRGGVSLDAAALDNSYLFSSAGLFYETRPHSLGNLRALAGALQYRNYVTSRDSRDALRINLNALFAWNNRFVPGDLSRLNLTYELNGTGDGGEISNFQATHYQGFGAAVAWNRPVTGKNDISNSVGFEAAMAATARFFYNEDPDEEDSRRDLLVKPGIALLFKGLAGRPLLDGRLHYQFEHNTSNDSDKRYQNHVIGIQLSRNF